VPVPPSAPARAVNRTAARPASASAVTRAVADKQRGGAPGGTRGSARKTQARWSLSWLGNLQLAARRGRHRHPDHQPRWQRRTHATVNVSDPDNVTGTSVTQLGVMNGVQRRYPDGSVSTRVTLKGGLANGKITGTWHDKFQNGPFEWSVGAPQCRCPGKRASRPREPRAFLPPD